jgi:hypothetical protein
MEKEKNRFQINILTWFDKINGNSYFAAEVFKN